MVLCEQCGYDLRGSAMRGNCPECATEYDQDVLRADQTRSYRTVTTGLKVMAVLAVLYLANGVCWVVAEDFLNVSAGPAARVTVLIGIPGGAALLLAFALLLLRIQHMNRLNRPYTDIRQARLIPSETRFWITLNIVVFTLGLFLSWGNPVWKALLRFLRSSL